MTNLRICLAFLGIAALISCGRLGFDAEGLISSDGGGSADSGGTIGGQGLGGQLLSGWFHTCLVRNDEVRCWGDSTDGQFGMGEFSGVASVPMTLTGLAMPPSDITAGNEHMCAIMDGDAYCWGHGKSGELGNGDTNQRDAPTLVEDLPAGKVTAIDAGASSTCAVADGAVYCWGHNSSGQLGDGTYQDSPSPRFVLGIEGTPVAINTGVDHACALIDDGGVYCWGHDDNGALGVGSMIGDSNVALRSLMTGADQVSIASVHACAVASGAVSCWGTGGQGELGDGNYEDSHTPVPVLGLDNSVTAMFTAAGNSSNDATCAIQAGSVYCWGRNNQGRLGDGTTDARGEPVEVWLPAPAIDIAGGAAHACALLEDDNVWCWGRGNLGQLGDGQETNSLTPVQVVL